MNEVVIIDYGAGNIQSVQFALERLGVKALLTNDIDKIKRAGKVILPGVGHAGPAMKALQKQGLDKLIPDLKQPVLGICLGMQLMCSYSEENQQEGLGIFNTKVRKFSIDNKVPHMGWNSLEKSQNLLLAEIEDNAYTYFVHSFYAEPSQATIAVTTYGIRFSAALQKDNFYGCQFHPEKSGYVGEQILRNFLMIN